MVLLEPCRCINRDFADLDYVDDEWKVRYHDTLSKGGRGTDRGRIPFQTLEGEFTFVELTCARNKRGKTWKIKYFAKRGAMQLI